MPGDDENKPKGGGSIEDWLATRLGQVDDDPLDSAEVSFTEAEQAKQAADALDAADALEPGPDQVPTHLDGDAGAEPHFDLELPEPDLEEPVTETPPAAPPRQPPHSAQLRPPPGQAPQPLGDAGPIQPEDRRLWTKDGDTVPLPPAPDPFASPASRGAPATVDFDAQQTEVQKPKARPAARHEPFVEDPDETTLPDGQLLERLEKRMPGNTFDEVFPSPPREEGQENTAALLAGVDRLPAAPTRPPLELMEIDDEAAPGNIHTEPTAVSIPPPGSYDPFAGDDHETVISAPPARGPIRGGPTPRPQPHRGNVEDDEGYSASVLAWTASTFGVLLFGALTALALVAVAQYFDLLQLEMLDLDLLPTVSPR